MITENQYKELCSICDNILLSSDSSFARIAIPFLHLVRESPNLMQKYYTLFSNKLVCFTRIRWFLTLLLRLLLLMWHSIRYFSWNKDFTINKNTFPDKVDVLFISHFLNYSHSGKSDDFYFSNLPDQLSDYGYSSVVALINHTSDSNNDLVGKWNVNQIPRVILTRSLCLIKELVFFGRMICESVRLRYLAKNESNILLQKTLFLASCEALKSGSTTNLRLSSQIYSLVTKLSPKAIIVTYEGHGYERIIFASARCVIPEIKCIGYQHAILFRLQHAILRNLKNDYNPDVILTSGLNSKLNLQKSTDLKNTRIEIMGSNRSSPEQIDDCFEDYLSKIDNQSHNEFCLVIPEGNAIESNFIFNFTKECAELCPNITFIWRLHPQLTFKTLVKNNSNLRKLPKNIVISSESFEKDNAKCRWVIYRGTTAIFRSVFAGLQPIYVSIPGEMTIDPLHSVNGWRLNISSPKDFAQIINSCTNKNSEADRKEQHLLYLHCLSFFSVLDSNVLINLLQSK